MSGTTPNKGFHYPTTTDVYGSAIVQTLATDLDNAYLADEPGRAALFQRPTVRASASTGNVVKNTQTLMPFTGATSNTTGMWNIANAARLVATVAGLYYATFYCNLSGSGTYIQQMSFLKNGSAVSPNTIRQQKNLNGVVSDMCVSGVFLLSVSDYLQCNVLWNGAAAGPFTIFLANAELTFFAAVP